MSLGHDCRAITLPLLTRFKVVMVVNTSTTSDSTMREAILFFEPVKLWHAQRGSMTYLSLVYYLNATLVR